MEPTRDAAGGADGVGTLVGILVTTLVDAGFGVPVGVGDGVGVTTAVGDTVIEGIGVGDAKGDIAL